MTDTFPTTVIGPTYPMKIDYTPKLIKVSFGDGYSQVTPDGLNSLLLVFNLTWQVLTVSEKTTIANFLISQGGYKSFAWTDPTGVSRLVKCFSWSFSNDNPNTWSLTAVFNETPL